MKNKILCVFFAVTALMFCFIFSASAGLDIDTDSLLDLDFVTNYDECVAVGDINDNGKVEASDARIILRVAVALDEIDTSAFMKADIDGDGKISAQDARLALRLAVGLDKLPEHNIHEVVIIPATCKTEGITVKVCTSCVKLYAKITVPASTDKHITGAWTTVTKPDCVNKGLAQLICIACGEVVKEEELAATNKHSGEWIYPDGKSCLDPVPKYRTCTVCGYLEETVENPVGGHNFRWTTEVKNTCTENGKEVYKCAHCGLQSKEQITAAHGHLFEANVTVKEATCEETGLVAKQCVYCELTKEEFATPALGHNFDNQHYKVTSEPTCAKKGTADVVCSTCGLAKEIELERIPHTLTTEWSEISAPTCTEPGSKEGVCRYCGPVIEDIPANGHTVTTWTNVKPASCTEVGIMQGECSVCGDTSATKEIEMKPHEYSNVQYWTSGVLCQENGTGYLKCKFCDAKKQIIMLQRACTNKNFGKTRTITEATCTTKETIVSVCDFCKKDINGTIKSIGNALGHEYLEENCVETKKATCTEKGQIDCKCTRCNSVKTTYTDATGHIEGTLSVTRHPSCALAGLEESKCLTCGETVTSKEIAKLPHTEKKIIISDSGSINADGNYIVKCKVICSVCDELISESETFTRIAVEGDYVVEFDVNSNFTPGGEVYFTVQDAAEDMYVMIHCGLDIDIEPEYLDGVYSFTIPEDISDTATITILVMALN